MLVEDYDAFLIDFGVDAVVSGRIVRGVFDARYQDALGISGSAPALLCVTAAVAHAQVGDAVSVAATAYTLAAIQPDGAGMTLLILEAA